VAPNAPKGSAPVQPGSIVTVRSGRE
jgi:hypothetical protein